MKGCMELVEHTFKCSAYGERQNKKKESALNLGPLGLAEERETGLQTKVCLKFCQVF